MMSPSPLLGILLFPLLLSACSTLSGGDESGGTRFYSLSSLPPVAASNKLRIGVGPLEIPRLLNRPQIISRKNSNEIKMAENHQWGGSYKEELIQTLADNLSSLLKTDSIEQYPWKFAFKPSYQIRVNIERFDGEIGKSITLKARWRLLRNNKEILVKQTLVNTPIHGNSYTDYVKAQSQALETFSKKIADKIKYLRFKSPST
ncbi:MAG TPA: membrane integrity-associated transporter subunit PqiC [Leucothrix mucor]|nr:membrane integrity-associated transporter subunit PqiC [Leucothrix mucor]